MGRATGSVNRDHQATREGLARQLAQQLLSKGGGLPSLRALADGVGVDPGTLRHYFKDRTGAVSAALETLLPLGDEQKARALALKTLEPKDAFVTLFGRIVSAWGGLLGAMHATGLVEGIVEGSLGRAYVTTMLEPTLATIEALLEHYRATGQLSFPDARVAGLALTAPVLLACLHQHQLEGAACRPLDLQQYVAAHVEGFLRGHRPTPSSSPS